MTSEPTDLASTKISEKMEDRRVIRDLRLKKNIVKNREKKKKKFSVKCAKIARSHTAPSGRSLTSSMTSTSLTASRVSTRRLAVSQRMNAQLKENNAKLARSLNAALIDNRRLTEELSEARMEMADMRQNRMERDSGNSGETATQWDDAAVEAECQKRLVAYLETVKTSMTKVLDDTFLLTEDVTKTMQLVSAPARRSRSTASSVPPQKTSSNGSAGDSTPPPVSHPMRRAPVAANTRPKPSPSSGTSVAVAHVSPRVGGHAIHKPQIEIQRLGMDEINRYQEEQRQRRRREEEQEERESGAEGVPEEEEEEPLAPRNNEGDEEDAEAAAGDDQAAEEEPVALEQRPSRSSRYSRYRMSIIGEESEEQTEEEEDADSSSPLPPPPPSDRARRRRQRRRRTIINSSFQDLGSPVVLLHDASALLDQYNLSASRIQDDEEVDAEDGAGEPAEAAESTPTRPRSQTPTRPSKKKVSFAASSPVAKETVILVPRIVLERVTTTEMPRVRESNEDFFRRLSGIDALEGPSWLFNESAASPGRPSDQRKSGPKKSDQRKSDQRSSDHKQVDPVTSDQRVNEESDPRPASEAPGANETSEPRESDIGGRKRSSRAAASAASYKEPSLNKKMRQGDPNSASVYKDYVPQTKARKKSSGGSARGKKNSKK